MASDKDPGEFAENLLRLAPQLRTLVCTRVPIAGGTQRRRRCRQAESEAMLTQQMQPTSAVATTEVARHWGRVAQLLCAADRSVRVPAGRSQQMRVLIAGEVYRVLSIRRVRMTAGSG